MVPALYPEKVPIAVAIVVLLTLGNLRGVRESGTIFMAPTYLYMVAVMGLIAFGLIGLATGIVPYTPPPEWIAEETSAAAGALGLLLVLRAFVGGGGADRRGGRVRRSLAFKVPEWRNARTTLTWAAVLFAILFVGISLLVSILGIHPDPSESRRSSTSWRGTRPATALPRLRADRDGPDPDAGRQHQLRRLPAPLLFLARDGFMPRQFGFRGDRLAFSTGIIALAGLAIVLLLGFQASVSALIPLYTLGVFVAFTLSQSGMVRRWWHRREPGWRRGLAINGLGAITTGVIVVVVAAASSPPAPGW